VTRRARVCVRWRTDLAPRRGHRRLGIEGRRVAWRLVDGDAKDIMALLSLEHSKVAYGLDFALYGAATVLLAASTVASAPDDRLLTTTTAIACVASGLAGWTLIEYTLHRFVLHGLAPFRSWHLLHHQRPMALIYSPTLLSAALIAALVFSPLLLLWGLHVASAITLGVVLGNLTYSVMHHAAHHWPAHKGWLARRKRLHARHHGASRPNTHFGVTTGLWDRVFGSGAS
jgi:sterol desaturase/sphingolipid hydroxylase (fatty acid hydroxylase superfamily)